MKINLKQYLIATVAIATIFLSSCSKDKPVTPEEEVVPVKGVFVLNEGSMGADNSSLSALDFTTNTLTANIFAVNNKDHSLGSGVADMDVYGSLLFITATESNKIEILNASNAKVIKTITVEKPRFVAFHSGKAFVTSYTNKVIVIDTLTKSTIGEIAVGRTPEYIVTLGDKLYVANSGSSDAITGGEYDNRVIIIDPALLKVEGEIEVADNVYHLFTNDRGELFANTMDVYVGVWPLSVLDKPSRLYKINTATKEVEKAFEFGAGLMSFFQNKAYLISYNFEENKTNLLEMDLASSTVKKADIFSEGALTHPNYPYALSINPKNGDLWYANSDYTNPGTVYHYNNGSKEIKEYTVGLNPSVFVFN